MQRIAITQYVDVLSHNNLDFTRQDIDKLFTFVMVTDALMVLFGFNGDQKRLQVFIFSSGCQRRVSVIFGSLGVCLDATFKL